MTGARSLKIGRCCSTRIVEVNSAGHARGRKDKGALLKSQMYYTVTVQNTRGERYKQDRGLSATRKGPTPTHKQGAGGDGSSYHG